MPNKTPSVWRRRLGEWAIRRISGWSGKAEQRRLNAVGNFGFGRIVEDIFPGSWQQNVEISKQEVTAHYAVFACMTLIASDIGKMTLWLMYRSGNIWKRSFNPVLGLVLKKPNPYQTIVQFLEAWVLSKLQSGNTYVLKTRNEEGIVVRLDILRPDFVRPLVSDLDGSVFYEIRRDELNSRDAVIIVPASEVIHDRFNCLYHPLVGVSPIMAAGLAAAQGQFIQESAARFFKNASHASVILSAPGSITAETAARVKAAAESALSGENVGRMAVFGDGLKFEKSSFQAVDSQVIDQLKWTAEVACSVFHVPPYKIGVGSLPSYNNVQALNVEYFSQALQSLIQAIESLLDEGLELPEPYATGFDESSLLRMDSVSLMQELKEGVSAGIYAPNEARARRDLDPVEGGESPYLQQQNFSLAALAKRDAQPAAASGQPAPARHRQPCEAVEVEELRQRLDALETRPQPIGFTYREQYSPGETYGTGDFVTHDGALWACLLDGTRERPGTGSAWRLAVKSGRR